MRVRSCGRARKRGGGGEVISIIGVLLSKDHTECGQKRVNERENRAGEKICQSNILCGQRERKIGLYTLIEMSADK